MSAPAFARKTTTAGRVARDRGIVRRARRKDPSRMASIANDPNGYRRILFMAADGRRKTVRLGKVSDRDAERIKDKVEQLNAAARANLKPSGKLAEWLAGLGDDLHAKLV